MYRVIGSIFGYKVGDLIDLSTASEDTLAALLRTGTVVEAVEAETPAPKAKGKA